MIAIHSIPTNKKLRIGATVRLVRGFWRNSSNSYYKAVVIVTRESSILDGLWEGMVLGDESKSVSFLASEIDVIG